MSDFTEVKTVITHLIIEEWKGGKIKTTYDMQNRIRQVSTAFFSPKRAKEIYQDVKQSVFAEMRKGA